MKKMINAFAASLAIFFLGIGAAAAQPGNPYANAAGSYSGASAIEDQLNVWERQLVQEGLILLGHYNGFATGTFGKATREAIAKFQAAEKRPATGELTPADALALGGTALALQKKLDWRALDRSPTGISMSYPAAVLTQRKATQDGGGDLLDSADGRLSLMTVRLTGVGDSKLDEVYRQWSGRKNARVTYELRRDDLFIVSGVAGNASFYSRAEQRGDELRGYDLIWSNDGDARLYQSISVLMSNSFYPFGDAPARGEASYPTLLRLADAAKGGGAPRGDPPPPSRGGGTGGNAGGGADDIITEQDKDALPPPADGSLTTAADGRGLRFYYHYVRPEKPELQIIWRWAVNQHLLVNLPEIDALDGVFVLPRPLHYVARECGMVNAYYQRDKSIIVVCYELIQSLSDMAHGLSKGMSDPMAFMNEFVRANLRFILLHESGHALIHMLNLPAVGREEDAVDQMAAFVLLTNVERGSNKTDNDVARVLQLASVWFQINSGNEPIKDVRIFADEHSLSAQRYFNILCLAYGHDPKQYAGIVTEGLLPKERAARCANESRVLGSWARLLVPYFAPRYKPLIDNPNPGNATTTAPPPPAQKNPLEWDGRSNPFGGGGGGGGR